MNYPNSQINDMNDIPDDIDDINENNLHFLSEEVSQYIDGEDNNIQKGGINTSRNLYTSKQLMPNFSGQEDINYYKYRIEEMNKDLIDKMNLIQTQGDQMKEMELLIDNLKKNTKTLYEKLSQNEKVKIQMNIKDKELQENENETNMIKIEYMKLQETIVNKDNIINEFQRLAEVSKSKFRMFEETNSGIRTENENLKKFVNELKEKIRESSEKEKSTQLKLNELLAFKSNCESTMDEQKLNLVQKEDRYRAKFEEKERQIVQKHKEREESLKAEYIKEISQIYNDIETYRIENEKLKIELKNVNKKVDESDNIIHDKEGEFKRITDSKDKEYEKLQRTLKELQREIHDLELKYNDKTQEFANKYKNFDEIENKLYNISQNKDRKIKESDDEMNNLKNFIFDIQANIKEHEIRSENKDKMIEQLKNLNSEILQEYNRKELEYNSHEDNRAKEFNDVLNKFNELNLEKNDILQENEELRSNLLHTSEKLREMNELIENKYHGLETDYQKEKTAREGTEKKYKEAIKKMKDRHNSVLNENNSLKQLLMQREEETNTLRLKYENKIQTLQLKLEEQEYCRENLVEEMSNIKDWAFSIDRKKGINAINSSHHHQFNLNDSFKPEGKYPNYNTNASYHYDRGQKQTLDNMRDIISKIDSKLNNSQSIKSLRVYNLDNQPEKLNNI